MNDRILIEGLAVETCIGVHAWERRLRQTVVLDLALDFDLRPAGRSDALADTLDYQGLCAGLSARIAQSGYELIEALAEDAAAWVLAEFPVASLRLKLSKPGAIPQARNIAVQIERRRAGP